MKILVLKQPFPMGNYALNTVIGNFFHALGHEAYVLDQLNGATPTEEYVQQIEELDPDIVYMEMLDIETFKIVEKLRAQKILLFASKGVLNKHEDIINYNGRWFDKIITNSKKMHDYFISNKIDSEFFEYYFSVLDDNDLILDPDYNHDCTFLGMGYHRLHSPNYAKERNTFFSNFKDGLDYKIYGAGWPEGEHFSGLLPPNHIGRLYYSAKTGVALIDKSQRMYGQINNRYSEMAFSMIPIITLNYPEIDWYGAEKYIYFVEGRLGFYEQINEILSDPGNYVENALKFRKFIENQHTCFFDKLTRLIGE